MGNIFYEDELRESFLEYSMSVITSRALPDIRDGLKPVQRRVLYAMFREGHTFDSKYTKCAGIVGEVLKRYHPHGDASVYDTLVRLAQDWVMRYQLVDGQGNFGSIDGDSPAAYRYTEARLSEISSHLLADIKKDTVDFAPNYNNSDLEPLVLPTRVPQLLVNGCAGIAVGMATNIPPHNLAEVVSACVHVIDHPDCKITDLFNHVKGPDFPTGALILGKKDFRDGYLTGKGMVKMRGVVELEDAGSGRQAIVITALPYNVNKARLIERIADLVKVKKIDGIQELRDESDKKGMRIYIGLKKGALSNLMIEKLYQLTPLQSNFAMNFVALVGGKPKTVNLLELIAEFLNHRKEVVRRRSLFELKEAKARAHILEGLKIIVDHKDEYLKKILPASKDKASLKDTIEERFSLSELQSEAIVILPNYRFSGLERDKIVEEFDSIQKSIKELESLLSSEKKLVALIKSELEEVKAKFGEKRRSKLAGEEEEVDTEDLIPDDPCYVAITEGGFFKRYTTDAELNLEDKKSRVVNAGDDIVIHSRPTTLHHTVLSLYADGSAYALKAHQLPNMRRYAKGSSLQELLGLKDPMTSKFLDAVEIRDFSKADRFVLLITREGVIKKIPVTELSAIRKSGVMLMRPRKKDVIKNILVAKEKDRILLLTEEGKAFVVSVEQIPTHTKGVGGGHEFDSLKGMSLAGAAHMGSFFTGATADGLVFGFSQKDIAEASASKGVSVKALRKRTIVAVASVEPEYELVVLTEKGKPLTLALPKRVSGVEETLDIGKTDSVRALHVIGALPDQMALPLNQ